MVYMIRNFRCVFRNCAAGEQSKAEAAARNASKQPTSTAASLEREEFIDLGLQRTWSDQWQGLSPLTYPRWSLDWKNSTAGVV